jgi:hypothetical protein
LTDFKAWIILGEFFYCVCARNTTITEKILGLDVKGIDEDTPEVLSEEKGPRKPAGVPQVEYGTSRKPKKPQRIEQLNDSSKMMEASNPN